MEVKGNGNVLITKII